MSDTRPERPAELAIHNQAATFVQRYSKSDRKASVPFPITKLRGLGFDAELLVPEVEDVSLADCIAAAAAVHLPSMKLRGVLTENGFMTNEQECRWLQTDSALEALAQTYIDGITEYILTLA